VGNLGINTSLQNQSLAQVKGEQLVQNLRQHAPQDSSKKIDKAARDFESILVGQWLEQAEKSFATVPGEDPDQKNDSTRDQFQSIACQSLAEGLSKGGGFGIAAMISKQLRASQASAGAEKPVDAHVHDKAGVGKSQNTR
jgi:Rod binding domain-containing protein